MARVLLFGGSFDPIHHGHLIVARAAAERIDAGRVVLIPAARPPHKPGAVLAPASDRLAMCRLAVEGDALFEVSDFELSVDGPNYTLTTVRHFRAALPGASLYWLIGADSLAELREWHRIGELAAECTFVTVARSGKPPADTAVLAGLIGVEPLQRIDRHILDTPLIAISATAIRERVRGGRSIRYLVPEGVERYIRERGLYR